MHEKLSGGTGIYSGGGNQSNSVTIKSGGGGKVIDTPKVTPSDTTHIVCNYKFKYSSDENKKYPSSIGKLYPKYTSFSNTKWIRFNQWSYDGYKVEDIKVKDVSNINCGWDFISAKIKISKFGEINVKKVGTTIYDKGNVRVAVTARSVSSGSCGNSSGGESHASAQVYIYIK